jgi:DNA polymerase-3 subunit beta
MPVKLSITGAALNTGASWAARIAPSNPAGAPIMGGVLLDADEAGLEFRATDFDTFGNTSADAQVGEPGKAVVSARLLASIAKTLRGDDQVTLETGPRGVELRVKRYKASLPVLGLDDWAKWPAVGDPIGTIPAPALSRGLARVLPAASDDGTLPVLTGVEFAFGDTLTLAATDKYRIAAADLPWQPTIEVAPQALTIPSPLLATMRDAIESDGGDVTLYSDGNTVTLATRGHRVTGRLIDGAFVKWQRLMKQAPPATTVTVSVTALGRAVKQVSAAVEGKQGDQLRLEITETGIEVALAADPESSSDIVEPGDFNFAGKPIAIGVSCRYLRDALACVDAPMVELRLAVDPTRPFLMFAAGEDGTLLADGYRHLLIATRLRELVAA